MNNEAASCKQALKGTKSPANALRTLSMAAAVQHAESLAQVGSRAGLLTEKRVSNDGSHRRNQVLLRVQNKAGGKIVVLT